MAENILYSKKTKSLAKSYDVSVNELAFADLIAAGWDTADAFFFCIQEGKTWTMAAVEKAAREILARTSVKKRIRELRKGDLNEMAKDAVKGKTEKPTETDDDVMKQLSKENMLRDLFLARKKMAVGSKDWLDTNKMIADITRMKQEEVKTEDNTVHFYLPLTCNKCSLYLENKKRLS